MFQHLTAVNLTERGFIFIGYLFALDDLMTIFADVMLYMRLGIASSLAGFHRFQDMLTVDYCLFDRRQSRLVRKRISAYRAFIIIHVSVFKTGRLHFRMMF